jgi:leucyl aminopeptidase
MEEVGLEGSGQLAQWFFERRVALRGVLQLDMTAYTTTPGRIVFISDWTTPALTRFTELLARAYLAPPVEVEAARCRDGEPCSDHVSWCARGYPAVFPFEAEPLASNPRAHTAHDLPQHLDPGHAHAFLRLAAAFLVELAEPTAP